jgi:hypothetical protein
MYPIPQTAPPPIEAASSDIEMEAESSEEFLAQALYNKYIASSRQWRFETVRPPKILTEYKKISGELSNLGPIGQKYLDMIVKGNVPKY